MRRAMTIQVCLVEAVLRKLTNPNRISQVTDSDNSRGQRSDNRGWNRGQQGRSGWYSKHTPGGYANYEQFRNGNYFGTL